MSCRQVLAFSCIASRKSACVGPLCEPHGATTSSHAPCVEKCHLHAVVCVRVVAEAV